MTRPSKPSRSSTRTRSPSSEAAERYEESALLEDHGEDARGLRQPGHGAQALRGFRHLEPRMDFAVPPASRYRWIEGDSPEAPARCSPHRQPRPRDRLPPNGARASSSSASRALLLARYRAPRPRPPRRRSTCGAQGARIPRHHGRRRQLLDWAGDRITRDWRAAAAPAQVVELCATARTAGGPRRDMTNYRPSPPACRARGASSMRSSAAK